MEGDVGVGAEVLHGVMDGDVYRLGEAEGTRLEAGVGTTTGERTGDDNVEVVGESVGEGD